MLGVSEGTIRTDKKALSENSEPQTSAQIAPEDIASEKSEPPKPHVAQATGENGIGAAPLRRSWRPECRAEPSEAYPSWPGPFAPLVPRQSPYGVWLDRSPLSGVLCPRKRKAAGYKAQRPS